jgi:hypothetical protein
MLVTILLWLLGIYLAGVLAVILFLADRFGPYAGEQFAAILSVALRWPDALLNRLFP